ncbi:MAG TPA: hypothetical protein PKW80_15285 [Bacteroidales bacterium]|nr:hypothetical protein [Bacteroidales bacterium]
MKNFPEFVNEIYALWRKKYPSLRGFSIAREKGEVCEEYVIQLLLKHGFECFVPGNKRTPADIYAIKSSGSFMHILLIQVRVRRIGSYNIGNVKPRDIEYLEKLVLMVKNNFIKSELTNKYHNQSLVVSGIDTVVDLYQEKIKLGFLFIRRNLISNLDPPKNPSIYNKVFSLLYLEIMSKNHFSQRFFNQLEKQDPEWHFRTKEEI